MKHLTLALLALPALSVGQQFGFFDDFNGTTLSSGWSVGQETFEPVNWDVSGGSLNLGPTVAPSTISTIRYTSPRFDLVNRATFRTRMFLDPMLGGSVDILTNASSFGFPELWFSISGTGDSWQAWIPTGEYRSISPGWNEFEVRSVQGGVDFLVNGSLLHFKPVGFGADEVILRSTSLGGPQDRRHARVDFVEVVPEPATFAALGLGLAFGAARRKKS